MCLAIPAQILELDKSNDDALVALGEIRKRISIVLLESVDVGDYVLVHVGYALEKISAVEAEKTLQLIASLAPPGERQL